MLHIAARAERLDCLKYIVPKVGDDLKTATDKVCVAQSCFCYNITDNNYCCIWIEWMECLASCLCKWQSGSVKVVD